MRSKNRRFGGVSVPSAVLRDRPSSVGRTSAREFESSRARHFTNRARYHALPAAAPASRMIPASCGSPGREPRNPARDVGPEILVLAPKLLSKHRLLVRQDKGVEGEPHEPAVSHETQIAEQDRLAQNDGDKGNVNRIAHV